MKDNLAKRVQKHRTALRKAGLRPIQNLGALYAKAGVCRGVPVPIGNCPEQTQEKEALKWLEQAADHEGLKSE